MTFSRMNPISAVLNELQEDVIDEWSPEYVSKLDTLKADKGESKVYIQQKEYFLETTRDKLMSALPPSSYHQPFSWNQLHMKEVETALDVAILFQRKSHIVSNLCYGLLGGISLMHLVLTYTLVKGSKHEIQSFIELYSKFGYVPSASFSILTTICLVFALDRIDFVTIKKIINQEEHIFVSNWIHLLLYAVTFILSVMCFKFDEIIALYPETKDKISSPDDLWIWRTLNLWRCIFGICGWFFVCITQPYDLLEHHLCSLKGDTKERSRNSSQHY